MKNKLIDLLEAQLIALYMEVKEKGNHQRFMDFIIEIRNSAYSIGYRHGHEDRKKG